jgi:hypothetical protein
MQIRRGIDECSVQVEHDCHPLKRLNSRHIRQDPACIF